MSYVDDIEEVFEARANPKRAAQQKAYLRGQFEFFGLTSPIRRELQKPILLKAYLPKKEELHPIINDLWKKPQREFHYFAMELLFKYYKTFDQDDMELFEKMAIQNSWWDTIDYIAPKLMASYLKNHPHQKFEYVDKWNATDNIWLRRCGLIFQLHYKNDMDPVLIEHAIKGNLGSSEFFINKAIGWILRNYSRQNPDSVIAIVDKYPLSNLSRREALRLL